jgi:hypothetical protein
MKISSRWKLIAVWVILFVLCASVTVDFFTPNKASHMGINSQLKFSFVPSIKGWAVRPFVLRALVPQTIALVLKITPDAVERSATQGVKASSVMSAIFARLFWEPEYAFAYYLCVLIEFFMFFFFAIYGARFVLETTGTAADAVWRRLAGCGLLLGLPPFFKFTSFLYDPAQLFLFTGSLYYLYKRAWKPYLMFFTLTCINKETAILLIPIFFLTNRGVLSDSAPRRMLAAQAAIFVAARALLAVRFRSNPGHFMEFHLLDHNLNVLAIGYGWSPFLLLALLTLIWLYKWRQKPGFLRASFVCTLPLMFLIYLFVGWIDEWRVYYEAYPTVFAMAIHTFRSLAGQIGPPR